MKPGEILLLETKDYPYRQGPYYILKRITEHSSKKYEYHKIADNSGWVIERIA